MTQQYVKLLTTGGFSRFKDRVGTTYPAEKTDSGWRIDGLFFFPEEVEEVYMQEERE